MTDRNYDVDSRVLSELNSRTLVGGATINPNLIGSALGLDESAVQASLARLRRMRLVVIDAEGRVGITPAGHEHVV